MDRLEKSVLTVVLLLTFACANGQYHNLDFRPVDRNNSIAQAHILCMHQDSQGFLWLGTFNGLYRYDGYSFSKFSVTKAEGGLEEFAHEVHALFEDEQHQLWIGTPDGIYIVNKSSGMVRHLAHDAQNKNSLSNNFVKCIAAASDSSVFIGTYGGGLMLYNLQNEQFTTYTYNEDNPAGITSNFINTIFTDEDDNVWIGTEGGGITIFDKAKQTFSHPQGFGQFVPDNTINCITEDHDGLWIGTWNKGLYKYEKSTATFIHHDLGEGKATKTIRAIIKDWNGNLWLANYGDGLTIYNPLKKEVVHYQYILSKEKRKYHRYLWSLYKDNSDIVWIGSFGAGLYNYDRNKIRVQNFIADEAVNEAVSDLAITVVMEDKKERLWLGTLGNGVVIYDPHTNTLTRLSRKPLLENAIIQSIYEDREGRVWIGTDDGLWCVKNMISEIVWYEPDVNNKNSISNNGIYAIRQDADGDLWLGIWGNGINLLRKKEIDKKDPRTAIFTKIGDRDKEYDKLSKSSVWKIQEYKAGELFFCTNQGLYKYTKRDNLLKQLSVDNVNAIYQDSHSHIWVSTYGKGVLRYNTGKETFESFTVEKGIVSNVVYGFSGDSNGNTWLFADKGITRLNPDKGFVQNFLLQEDLSLIKIGQKAFSKLHNGLILIGGERGLRVFNPESVHEGVSDNPVYITDVKILNKSISTRGEKFLDIPSQQQLDIRHNENNVQFEFSGLNFSGPEKVKYAYKLEGFDKDWVYTDADHRTATYANLHGGSYTFIVRSMNLNGSWNKHEAMFQLQVIPPFWQTLPFKILLLAAIALLIFLAIRIHENRVHKDYILKSELLKSERLIIENKELLNQRSIVEKRLEEKNHELTSSTLQVISKNQSLSSVRDEIQNILPQVNVLFKRKLEHVVNHINQDLNNESSWEKLNVNLNLVQDNFLSRFAEAYPSITHKDLKICAYIRMNISNDEIASLLNISGRSLEMSRYRIRKKISLDKKTQLNDFLMRF
ncbi:MAG TPA: two-component regulator propeller domain-containing protein [Ohtaekwangia sp.]|uniref:two-component regulator propeller domain-containing protein n=1 Tax=Ohtaekwangia sp. TaxID=2066019 RepID=UPI002F93B1C1